jgi:hypothetical protein
MRLLREAKRSAISADELTDNSLGLEPYWVLHGRNNFDSMLEDGCLPAIVKVRFAISMNDKEEKILNVGLSPILLKYVMSSLCENKVRKS